MPSCYLAMTKVGKKNVAGVLKERLLNFFVKMHAGKYCLKCILASLR